MRELMTILLLVGMILVSLYNIYSLKNIIDSVKDKLSESTSALYAGNKDIAISLAENARDEWFSHDTYTHAVIKHDKLDEISALFYDYIASITEDSESETVYCEKLISGLDSLYGMEKLALGSIFCVLFLV